MRGVVTTPEFEALLGDFDLAKLEAERSLVYGLWADLRLALYNEAWSSFASENSGAPLLETSSILGASVLDGMAESVRPFFREYYTRALREQRPWVHDFECSSAERYREFRLTAYPLPAARGLLVVSALRVETEHNRTAHPPSERLYRNADGILTQCSHCRRVRRAEDEATWDWVPAWVANVPPNTSHGLCAPCFSFYYSEEALERSMFPKPIETTAKDEGFRGRTR